MTEGEFMRRVLDRQSGMFPGYVTVGCVEEIVGQLRTELMNQLYSADWKPILKDWLFEREPQDGLPLVCRECAHRKDCQRQKCVMLATWELFNRSKV